MARAGERLPGSVRAWGAVSLLSDLAHEAVSALLPVFVASLGGTPVALGAIEGVSDGASALAKLWGGRLADRMHRLKGAVVLGYALTALAVPAIALAKTWTAVALLRSVGWLGRGFRSPLRDTLLVRSVPEGLRGRAFGLERALDQVGAVLAPLLVALGIALSVGVRPMIALAIVPGLACIGCLVVLVRETPSAPDRPRERADGEPPSPAMRRFLAAVALFGCGDFAKTLLVLWALGSLPEAPALATAGRGALLYGAFNLVTIGAAYLGGGASDRVGRKGVLAAGYALGAAGALVPVVAAPSWIAGLVALGLSGVAVGVEESVERAWAADLAGGRHGRAFGWLHAINGLGDLVASLGVGLAWSLLGPEWAFGLASVAMASGASLLAAVPSSTARSGSCRPTTRSS